ncbi:uncharacterized protein PV09_00154 [Verruconis gallopava]|uniref:F-box domain-containing protein n=1 Tax=Verruconis gallopava TaxID=253628 RepID=A0A0D1Z8B2_9PEZI|nr:uncharacterized protein PV09_00154 [Verruconis gallopava]KIW09227.1 hypothetical protein PV09_00154 [Verruconis gallopava]
MHLFFKHIISLSKAANIYVPEAWKPQESLTPWRFAMSIIRCWCAGWIGLSSFGTKGSPSTIDIVLLVKNHNELRHPPYSPIILPSLTLGVAMEFIAFGWNVACVALTFAVPWHLLLAVPDLFALVGLSVSQAQQYTFTPRSNSTCVGIAKWQVPPDGGPNFYVMAANLTNDTPNHVCSTLYSAMVWQAVVVFHEGLIVFLALTLALPKRHCLHLSQLRRTIFRLATLVPRECIYMISYLNEKRRRISARKRSNEHIELTCLRDRRQEYTCRLSTKMEQVLALEEALLVIASELHYQDLIRLSWTSKSIRELVFPAGDLKMRKKKLRRVTCVHNTLTCWNCNIKVCLGRTDPYLNPQQGCAHALPEPSALSGYGHLSRLELHETHCQPYCSACYYAKVCRSLFPSRRRPCACFVTLPTGLICGNCAKLEDPTAIRLEAKTRAVWQRSLSITECTDCQTELASGSAWWIAACGLQCRDNIHMTSPAKDIVTESV